MKNKIMHISHINKRLFTLCIRCFCNATVMYLNCFMLCVELFLFLFCIDFFIFAT